ncbi:MAG: thioredoxin family protein [Synergistaceae bacterium]|jgi:hypothetical protein|nr:thioredoxin family protein [Synergistaceae bacterium]
MLRNLTLILILSCAVSFAAYKPLEARAAIFSDDSGSVDISSAKTFEQYMATGSSEHLKTMLERFDEYKVSDFFAEEIKKIDAAATLLMIGMMYCPDCKVVSPFMEAIAKLNPKISTRYILRNDTPGAKEFMQNRTGRTNMPAIFVLSPDGTVLSGAYVETPERVTGMLASAATDGERDKIWDDFHEGVYDEDVQRDLIELIKNATDISKK